MNVFTLRALSLMLISMPFIAHAHEPETLTLITYADGTRGIKTPIDIGPPGPSQGDLFVFDQPLMNEQRQDIGSNSGYCVNTFPEKHSQCQWTLLFSDATGKTADSIVVAGQEHESGQSIVAVIGTTGKYAGFSGEMSTEPNADGTFTQILQLSRSAR
ncbi:hypothetical protein KW846_23695 [Pseudomonas sp. PDM32]|uniref:allene oxide cyclase barrel-like domain-containing protein n=1 Tax=Pseudomonas sp. PDM32 TaxID=2854768 RepID=UPI001C483F08|nr:hypothetical protein [Pseudomonas sp. PDM32]MBV7575724.1 hypothetical protein [Pseudomonas sp. PDM32]